MLSKQMLDSSEDGYERPFKVYVGNLPNVSDLLYLVFYIIINKFFSI